MITAQEQEIVQKIEKDEEETEAQRLDIVKAEEKKKEAIKLIDEGNLPQAVEIISNSEEIRDAVILHFNDRSMQLRAAKDFAAAVKSYSVALALSPQDENLHYNLGRVFYENSQLDEAQDCLDKAVKINPDFKEGRLFYEYLLKLRQTPKNRASGVEKRMGRFFRKILYFRKNE